MKFTEYFEVRQGERIRFQSVYKDEAIRHAQTVYRDETVICTIEAVSRGDGRPS